MTDVLTARQQDLNLNNIDTVVIAGVGGVGSWVAYFLATSGQVERLVLYDPDIVEEHNLNRTPYRKSDIGKPKVLALREILGELDRPVIVETKYEAVNKDTKITTYGNKVVVLDCRDVVDEFTLLSNIVIGYDGMKLTVHTNPKPDRVFRTDDHRGYYVPSYVVPPVIAGALVTDFVLRGGYMDEERIVNVHMNDLLGYFFSTGNRAFIFKIVDDVYKNLKIAYVHGKFYLVYYDDYRLYYKSKGYYKVEALKEIIKRVESELEIIHDDTYMTLEAKYVEMV